GRTARGPASPPAPPAALAPARLAPLDRRRRRHRYPGRRGRLCHRHEHRYADRAGRRLRLVAAVAPGPGSRHPGRPESAGNGADPVRPAAGVLHHGGQPQLLARDRGRRGPRPGQPGLARRPGRRLPDEPRQRRLPDLAPALLPAVHHPAAGDPGPAGGLDLRHLPAPGSDERDRPASSASAHRLVPPDRRHPASGGLLTVGAEPRTPHALTPPRPPPAPRTPPPPGTAPPPRTSHRTRSTRWPAPAPAGWPRPGRSGRCSGCPEPGRPRPSPRTRRWPWRPARWC